MGLSSVIDQAIERLESGECPPNELLNQYLPNPFGNVGSAPIKPTTNFTPFTFARDKITKQEVTGPTVNFTSWRRK